MSSSPNIRRRPDIPRDRENFGTIAVPRPRVARTDARKLFFSKWPAIRSAMARHPARGALVLVFDHEATPVGEAHVEATLDRTRALVIGRHSRCDLCVPTRHADLSLRQLALLVRAVDHGEVRLRAVDLRTNTPFLDEAGRELQAVGADAPLFLWVGNLAVMVLRTPEPGGWPDDPGLAYATLPQRVFVEEQEAREIRPRPAPRLGTPAAPGETLVRSLRGPVATDELLCGLHEDPTGILAVIARNTEVRYRIGERALVRGVLLGRYARCQVGILDEFSRLSRVHLLLVREGAEVLAVDTASTNGVEQAGVPRRVAALQRGDTLTLGDGVKIRWE